MDNIFDKLIDEQFIYIYNKDLSHMNMHELKRHYIFIGKREGRIFSDLHIQQIVRNRYFNIEFYTRHYHDTRNKNMREIINHYIKFGQKEGRIVSKTHAAILTKNPEFDIEFYKSRHADLHDMTPSQLVSHYIQTGKTEGRTVSASRRMIPEPDVYINNPAKLNNNINNDTLNISYYLNDNFDTMQDITLLNNMTNNSQTNNISIDNIYSFILVIDFPKLGGGTTVFLNMIIEKYKYYQTFVICRPIPNRADYVELCVNEKYTLGVFSVKAVMDFFNINNHKIIKVFVNHTLYHNSILIDFILDLDKEITLITHDYYMLYNKIHIFYEDTQNSRYNSKYINKFDKIISQNAATLSVYEPFLNPHHHNICISELPDYRKSLDKIITNNSIIVVGLIGYIHKIKGYDILNTIYNYINANSLNIQIIVFGTCYNEQIEQHTYNNIADLNKLLVTYKPNIILELSQYRETYSYTLTQAMLTQLPILSVCKPFNSTLLNRLSGYPRTYIFNSLKELIDLVYIVKQDYFYTIDTTIYFNSFWENYFITNKTKLLPNNNNIEFKHDIKPYFIYFPQFHELEENNLTFYKGYNDITNLIALSKSNHLSANIESPLLSELGIDTLENYNLTNINVMQKQIDIIYNYNIPGFALYYYWFSENTVTNKNMIMEKVINNFFSDKIDMKDRKVFFIWANESWSNNPAFGRDRNHSIINNYTHDNILKNVENLMIYFKHDNYLKINNKPVFFIYHTHLMTDSEIDLFFNILHDVCIQNSFDGVHFVVNSMMHKNNNYTNFYLNFNYKNNQEAVEFDNSLNCGAINYNKYINSPKHVNANTIQTVVYDFNNAARLFIPDNLRRSTICKNNTELDKTQFTNQLIETYNRPDKTELENILLINAFNEWGEKMTFEPSNKYGYYNINLLYNLLIK